MRPIVASRSGAQRKSVLVAADFTVLPVAPPGMNRRIFDWISSDWAAKLQCD
jgi:hypothetical protein